MAAQFEKAPKRQDPGLGGGDAEHAYATFTEEREIGKRFADQDLPDVVYLERLDDATYVDRRESVDHYYHVMELISARSAAPVSRR